MSKHRRSVTLVVHPLISHLLTEARDGRTPTERFREVVQMLGGLLAYEATRDLAVETKPITTPLEKCQGDRLRGPVTIVPIFAAAIDRQLDDRGYILPGRAMPATVCLAPVTSGPLSLK